MTIDEYDDTESPYFDNGISGYEIAYGSANITAIKSNRKQKSKVRQRIDLIQENRKLKQDTDTLFNVC
ncbi:hypothetical protein AAD001_01830 [Colwelliaceae bacterium 6471]